MRIGVECGGTFTDIVLLGDDGTLYRTDKVFSTPFRKAKAVHEGLRRMPSGLMAEAHLLHGSTVATNALIERKTSRKSEGHLINFACRTHWDSRRRDT